MASRILIPSGLLALAAAALAAADPPPEAGRALDQRSFAALHELIRPGPGEARWAQVPWMPATDLWAARRKAAAEGKPLFLWYMAGEPLGMC